MLFVIISFSDCMLCEINGKPTIYYSELCRVYAKLFVVPVSLLFL